MTGAVVNGITVFPKVVTVIIVGTVEMCMCQLFRRLCSLKIGTVQYYALQSF